MTAGGLSCYGNGCVQKQTLNDPGCKVKRSKRICSEFLIDRWHFINPSGVPSGKFRMTISSGVLGLISLDIFKYLVNSISFRKKGKKKEPQFNRRWFMSLDFMYD